MNKRLLSILVVAAVIAGVCTLLVLRLVRNQSSAHTVTTTRLVAASEDIKLGSTLTDANLTTIEIAGVAPTGAILAKNQKDIIGRGVVSDLYKGEPIIEDRLAGGKNGGLASTIPPGMRACAVRVDEVASASGFVTPGMRVDVLVSGVPPGSTNQTEGTVSRTLLQNIQVLSSGTEYQKDGDGKPKQVATVNLLVTPEQAEALSLASSQAKIQLVLRNPMDTKETKVASTSSGNLFAGTNTSPERKVHVVHKKAAPQGYSIEVINGSKTSQEKFATPEGRQ